MNPSDQRRNAIANTIRHSNEVVAYIYDDKIKEMGTLKVTRGLVSINLDYIPSMTGDNGTKEFLLHTIMLSLDAAYDLQPAAFDRHA